MDEKNVKVRKSGWISFPISEDLKGSRKENRKGFNFVIDETDGGNKDFYLIKQCDEAYNKMFIPASKSWMEALFRFIKKVERYLEDEGFFK